VADLREARPLIASLFRYWDGTNFYSRNGNAFPAPAWFKLGLPSTPLDGELWAGRHQFRRCLSIVRSASSGDLWQVREQP
jgi:DNA ligase 1